MATRWYMLDGITRQSTHVIPQVPRRSFKLRIQPNPNGVLERAMPVGARLGYALIHPILPSAQTRMWKVDYQEECKILVILISICSFTKVTQRINIQYWLHQVPVNTAT